MKSAQVIGFRFRYPKWAVLGLMACVATFAMVPLLHSRERASQHAASSNELRAAMQEIGRASIVGGSGFDDAPVSRANKQKIIAAAEAMTRSSLLIPGAIRSLGLQGEEKQEFEKLAGELHTQARELSNHARRENLSAARAVLDGMASTCNDCHSQFRIAPTGSE